MTKNKTYNSEFGASVSQALAEARINQSDLAARAGISPSYLNQTMTGRKHLPTKWIDVVAESLGLQEAQRKRLHLAAAKDAGYDVELTGE